MELIKEMKKFVLPLSMEPKEESFIYDLSKYFSWDENSKLDIEKGLLITGPVGCGKTNIFKCVQWSRKRQLSIVSTKNICENLDHYMSLLKKPKEWLIDDIGEENLANDYGKAFDAVGHLISARYELWKYQGVITHFTTNNTPQDLSKKYGERVASRLKEMVNYQKHPVSVSRRGVSKLVPPKSDFVDKPKEEFDFKKMCNDLWEESINSGQNKFKNGDNFGINSYPFIAAMAYKTHYKNLDKRSKEEKIKILEKEIDHSILLNKSKFMDNEFKHFKSNRVSSSKNNKYLIDCISRCQAKAFTYIIEKHIAEKQIIFLD